MTNDGTNALTYDANGNLTSDGVNTYTWDRANRMTQVDTGTPAELTVYAYDGLNNRLSQAIGTSSPVVTEYLNDTQPGLTKVIAQTTGANTDRFVHGPRGIHAMENHAGDWSYMAQDGLGSVRTIIDNTLSVDAVQTYDPIGDPMGSYGAGFGFTGEQTDDTGQLYLRARYYDPALGMFPSLDPFEGSMGRPMSLNGYSWVEGNPVMNSDPSGKEAACEHVLAALRQGTRYNYIASQPWPYNQQGCPDVDLAVTNLVYQYATCWKQSAATANQDFVFSLDTSVRLLVHGGFDVRTATHDDIAAACPEAYALSPCGSHDSGSVAYRLAIKQCFPFRSICDNKSLERLFASRPNYPDIYDVNDIEPIRPSTPDPNATSQDIQVLLLGGRLDASATILGQWGFDINIELQFVPWHLQPRYIGQRTAFGIVINPGGEVSSSTGAGITGGVLVGSVSSEGYGTTNPNGYTFGGTVQLGAGFEADVTTYQGSHDAVLYIGTGIKPAIDAGGIYGGTAPLSFFIDPGEAVLRVLRWMFN